MNAKRASIRNLSRGSRGSRAMRDVGLRSMAGHTRKRARTGSRSSLRGLALSLRSSKGTESRELARKLYIKKRNPYNTDARRCVPLAVYGPWLAGRPPCTGSAARPREAHERQHPRCNMRRMFRFKGAESVGANQSWSPVWRRARRLQVVARGAVSSVPV